MVSTEGAATAGIPSRRAELDRALDRVAEEHQEAIESAAYFVDEVGDLEGCQQRACGELAAEIQRAFHPEVLDILKGNADQLFQLKQAVSAEKQAAKENSKKMMLWMTGSGGAAEPSGSTAGQPPASDAVKQRGFTALQLSGSSIAAVQAPTSGTSWKALKFWQIGTHNSKVSAGNRGTGDTPGLTDQQPQKSLSSMLFGKNKRQSGGGGEVSASRRASIDPAASWRSSMDGSFNGRRASTRSSDAGMAMAAAPAGSLVPAGSSAERGAVMTSLAAGEGPLSKSHSMLATKPGAQQEQILGKSLEIVAEDEREGRDSPVPAEPAGRRLVMGGAGQALGLAPIRVPRSSVNRPGSPGDSFSFGNNRQEEEQAHSPNFMRASTVSSRLAQPGSASGVAGPLVRSSMALRASMVTRVDPFEAPEPEPQPFVEQLRAEQHDTAAGAGGSAGGIMAALRRSISGGGRAPGRWEGPDMAAGRPRQSMEGAGSAWSAAAGGGGGSVSASQQLHRQQAYTGQQQHQQQQQQQQMVSDGGASMQFLDLDATRAYALGVHQVMMRLEQNMQSVHSQSEASSRPTSPRGASVTEAAVASAPGRDAVSKGTAAPAAGAAAEAEASMAARGPDRQQTEALEQQQLQQQQAAQDLQQPAAQHQQQQQQQQQEEGVSKEDDASGHVDSASVPGSAYTPRAESEAAGMPPLRSGMSSPAASRRQTHLGGPPPASSTARQLPLMGQASMEILEKPPQLSASRQQSLLGTSTSVSLAEVYKQTSGNLAPLSSHLSGIGRRSSSTASKGLSSQQSILPSRAAAAPSSSRSILGDTTPPQGSGAATGMGPLAMQYGSTMQQAKKSAAAAGLAAAGPGPQDPRPPAGWGWQQGASSPLSAAAAAQQQQEAGGLDPAAFGPNNKYASSWGILDAGGLSRQSSMSGAAQVSRAPSGMPLTRQGSGSVRASPRQSNADEQQVWQQQQRMRGAAGRYAGASQTPGSQSPRSGTATPAREDSAVAAVGMQPGAARKRVSGTVGAQGRQADAQVRGAAHAREGSNVGSEDFESAEEQLSSGASGISGLSGPYGSAGGAGVVGLLPTPPAFLSGRPTSAQAAVATQWSPSKNAAAFAQAPAYMRDAVLRISPETSGASYGLAPAGLQGAPGSHVASPRDSNAAAGGGGSRRVSNSSIGARPSQTSAYESGGYNIYAPLDPPMARSQSGRQQQQQQPVLTAVDLARRQSMMRRASSTGVQPTTDYGSTSSNGRELTHSTSGQYTHSSFHSANGFGTVGTFPGGRQQQQQQQWGSGSGSQSGSIYGTVRPGQWQRQQYKF